MNKVLKAAWFATKIGIGGGVVYVTIDQGVWGSNRQASALYDRLYDVMPGTKEVSLKLPKPDDVNINFRSYWNTGVFYTFDFLANIPANVISLKDSAVAFVSSSVSSLSSEEAPESEAATPPAPAEEKVVDTPAEESIPPQDSSQPEEKSE